MASSVEDLFGAVKRGNLQEIRQLQSDASLIESKDAEGNTLLHVAAEKGDLEIVTELIKLGAKTQVFNAKGDTPLHIAALNGKKSVVKGLQTPEGCRIRGHKDRTVLHCACEGCPPEVVAELITALKSDVTATDSDGQTPLHVAALSGKEKTVKELITTFKCPVDCTDNRGYTPLFYACQNDHAPVVKLLVKYKASLTHTNASGETALDVAAVSGKAAIVELLVAKFGCNPNSQTRDGRTLLHSACDKGFPQLAGELVTKYKCNVNAEDTGKVTPLHLAAHSGSAQLIDLLVNSGAAVDCVDSRGCTPLHYACHSGNTDAVIKLCQKRADKKARNSDGRNALDLAALNGHVSVVKAMIADGGDPNEKDATGRTCLHHACCGGQKDILELLIHRPNAEPAAKQEEQPSQAGEGEEEEGFEEVSAEIFRCPVDSVDLQGKTPFHCACEFGHVEVVKALVGLGANVKARDNKGDTGLHMAASNGHTSVAHVLITDYSLDSNVNGCDGRTALHNACIHGHSGLVEDLLQKYKCDIAAKDDRGSTPLHVAAVHGNVKAVQILLTVGQCPPDVLDSKGSTPLHHACELGHLGVTQALIEAGASLTAHNLEEYAPLHLAILGNKREVVEALTQHCTPSDPAFRKKVLHLACSRGLLGIMAVLVKNGCGITEYDEEGCAPIHVAAIWDQGDAVRELVAAFKCPVNLLDSKGNTALHHASEGGHLATVKVLHAQGANLDICNKDGDAALHIAAFNGHSEVLKALVKYGCNVNYKSGYKKRIPLHYACDGGHVELVRDLVRKFRCDAGTQDENGLTPLHVAVVAGKTEVVRELVERCSLVMMDSYGCTPLRYACWGNNIDMVRILCNLEPRQPSSPALSSNAESSPSPEPTKEATPSRPLTPVVGRKVDRKALHYACEGSTLEMVRELIVRYKFDVNEEDARGWVPLHMAAQSGKEEIVKELLGVVTHSVDHLNADRQTPILLACEKGCVGVVKLLLSQGANPELKDTFGRNGIMKAMECHHDQVMEVLVAQCGWKRVFENITDYTDEHKKKYTDTLHKRKDKLTSKISQVDKELRDTQERCKTLEREAAVCREQCGHYKAKLEEYTQMNIALLEEKKRHFEEEKSLLESPVAKTSSSGDIKSEQPVAKTSSSGDIKSEQLQNQARRTSISAKYKGLEQRLNMVDMQIKQLKSSSVRSASKSELSARCPSGVESAPDVTDLLNLVVPHIQGRLLEVGLRLGLTKEAVEAIATDPSGQYWTRVFTEWRERAVKPYTWATLLDMLESSEISCSQHAQVLRAMITGGGAAGRERASSASKTEVDGPPAVEPHSPAVEPQGTGVASESLNTSATDTV